MSASGEARPRMVELIGPAGAGKSTLARVLPSVAPGQVRTVGLWGLPTRWLLAGACSLVPAAAAAVRARHPLHAAELAQMTRLEALGTAVARMRGPHAILFDEGPVYALAWLRASYGNGGPAHPRWWRRTLAHWAARLDAVVRLDAPDAVLATRIRSREKPHPLKHDSDSAIHGFTARFRRCFDQVVADLASSGPVRVLAFRTDRGSPAALAAGVLATLCDPAHER